MLYFCVDCKLYKKSLQRVMNEVGVVVDWELGAEYFCCVCCFETESLCVSLAGQNLVQRSLTPYFQMQGIKVFGIMLGNQWVRLF